MNCLSLTTGTKRTLIAIAALFAALALCYSFATKLKYGPDEPAHFIYIRSLAIDFTPPEISHVETPTEEGTSSHEGHQPPLYYTIMAVPYAALDACAVPADTIWRVLRLLTIPIGVLWLFAVFALTREFFGRDDYSLVTTVFVALIPTASYMAGVVNNESLISLLFTAAMLPILRFFKTGKSGAREAVLLGLVMGLAVIAKAQGLLLVPMLLLAGFVACRRRGYTNCVDALKTVGIALGVAVLVSGWWYVRCWVLYGTALPHSLYRPLAPSLVDLILAPSGPEYAAVSTRGLYAYFWVPFWLIWKRINSFNAYFYPLCVVTLAGLTGLVVRLRRAKDLDLGSLVFLLCAPLLTYVFWLHYVLVVDPNANLQGRLMLGVAAIVGIVSVLGFDGLLPSVRAKRIGVAVGAGIMLLANIGVIGCAVWLYSGS